MIRNDIPAILRGEQHIADSWPRDVRAVRALDRHETVRAADSVVVHFCDPGQAGRKIVKAWCGAALLGWPRVSGEAGEATCSYCLRARVTHQRWSRAR